MSGVPRPPAPNLSPDEMLRTYEFGIHEPEYLTGMGVIESTMTTPGKAIASDSFLVLHPLDLIALKCGDNVLARLDAAMEWIVADAHRKLDRLARRLGTDTFEEANACTP